jgi:para-aminobenzoate synthetase component 1
MLANTPKLRCRGQQRVALAHLPEPAEALEALLSQGASLLESRTAHPEARYSYVAFSPIKSLRLSEDALHVADTPISIEQTFSDRPVARLFAELDAVRSQSGSNTAPFTAGWVGYFAHEFGCRLLDTPAAPPCPPARPAGPLALFRLYRDALVIDHRENTATLHGSDWGEGETRVRDRLIQARALLEKVVQPVPAPAVVDEPTVTLTATDFAKRQDALQALIREGDCFQANLTSSWAWPWRVDAPFATELIALYRRYSEANPGAWCGFFQDGETALLSGSPELLVDWRGESVCMRPIAGTRSRGEDEDSDVALAEALRRDPKEQAEHTMLVDLVRNDLAHVCEAGSVQVSNLAGVERYRHVMHLVNRDRGRSTLTAPLPHHPASGSAPGGSRS